MDVQSQKEIIIEHVKQTSDKSLLNAIMDILDFTFDKKHESNDIPEAHQKLVMDRFEKVRKSPKRLLDWDKVKKTLEP